MTRLPPPGALASSVDADADLRVVGPATRLVRIFYAGGAHPQRWNSFRRIGPLPHSYFDPHPPGEDGLPARHDEHGVLYFSLSVRTSIAEVFQATSVLDRQTRTPHLVALRPKRRMRLLDLTGDWPSRVGATPETWLGDPELSQAWARALRQALPELDGLYYLGTDDGNPALCLWDPPGSSGLPARPDTLHPLDHPGLDASLRRVCEELNYTLG